MNYDTILLDADMTLFDFDRSEHEALCRVLNARGCPTDKETTDAYVRINWALWDDYAKGRVTQEEIGPRRFQALFALLGAEADPEACNREYQAALAECGYNQTEAARRLGMGRTTLYRKMKKFGIPGRPVPDWQTG